MTAKFTEKEILTVFDGIKGSLFRYAHNLARNNLESEDTVIDALYYLIKGAEKGWNIKSIHSMLWMCVRHEFLDRIVTKNRMFRSGRNCPHYPFLNVIRNKAGFLEHYVDPLAYKEEHELDLPENVLCAYNNRTEKQKKVMNLIIFKEMTFAEVGHTVGTSSTNAHGLYTSAIKAIRKELGVRE